MQRQLRTAAHDLRNLVARLGFLSENLKKEIGSPEALADATELLADTMEQLNRIADDLRSLASGKE